MAQISGRYALDTLLGQVFHGTTAGAGVVLPAFDATSPKFVIWNPQGSGKNVYLVKLMIGFVSGTITPSNFIWGYQTGAGSTAATLAPVTAFTALTPVNGYVGQGNAPVAKLGSAATLTTGCSIFRQVNGMSLLTTAASSYLQIQEDYDGTVIVPPGTLLALGSNVASGLTTDVTLVWEEV